MALTAESPEKPNGFFKGPSCLGRLMSVVSWYVVLVWFSGDKMVHKWKALQIRNAAIQKAGWEEKRVLSLKIILPPLTKTKEAWLHCLKWYPQITPLIWFCWGLELFLFLLICKLAWADCWWERKWGFSPGALWCGCFQLSWTLPASPKPHLH